MAARSAKAKAKKPHWTQTAKGRRHMKMMGLKRGKLMAKARELAITAEVFGKPMKGRTFHVPNTEETKHIYYTLGRVEAQIEYYCVGKNISPATLATELGKLLRHSEGR